MSKRILDVRQVAEWNAEPLSSMAAAFRMGIVLVFVLAGCCNVPVVKPGTGDTTPPVVRVTSINLSPDFDASSESASGPWIKSGIAPGAIEFAVTATATDAESGIVGVTLEAQVRVWCGTTATATSGIIRSTFPLSARTDPPPAADGSRTTAASTTLVVPMARIRAACLPGRTPVDWQIDLTAGAKNASSSPDSLPVNVSIVSGPTRLRFVVHNMRSPCLAELENPFGDAVTYHKACEFGGPVNPNVVRPSLNSVLDRWALFFREQDVILLSEATYRHWVDRLLAQMPGFHLAHGQDGVAILSRFPLEDVRHDTLTTPFSGQGVGSFPVSSTYTRATVAAPGRPFVAYAMHGAHRPSPPESSADNRLMFAGRMAADIGTIDGRMPVFVGGDFNSKSHFLGPDDIDFNDMSTNGREVIDERQRFNAAYGGRSMPEIEVFERLLRDARRDVIELNDPAVYRYNTGWRGDFLFYRGDFTGTFFDNTRADVSTPTDHPMLHIFMVRTPEVAPARP